MTVVVYHIQHLAPGRVCVLQAITVLRDGNHVPQGILGLRDRNHVPQGIKGLSFIILPIKLGGLIIGKHLQLLVHSRKFGIGTLNIIHKPLYI